MLSEDTLEKLLEPFIRRQEKLNSYVISIIAKRILEVGKLTPSDVYRLERLFETGSDVRLINEEIARVINIQISEVKALIKEVALNNYIDAKPYYDYRKKPFIPFEKNVILQRTVNAISKQTEGTFKNLSRSTAFMLRDPKNPQRFIPTNMSNTYQRVMDEAVQWTQQGVIDYNTAMERTLIDLGNSGLRYVNYDTPTGRTYTQRLDTAVRRNLLDGVRQINQAMQDEIGKQIEADAKELTAHINSAPDHEPMQGRVFSNEEFENLQNEMPSKSMKVKGQSSQSFEPIRRAIGEWNCHHFAIAVISEIVTPIYTEKQLNEFKKNNNKGYTTPNGKHLTMYQCTQMQRKYELAIRKARDIRNAADKAGNKDLINKMDARIKELSKQYKQFSNDCGLRVRMDKTRVFS